MRETIVRLFGAAFRRFFDDRRGGIATHLVIMAPAMLAATAFAVDYGRVISKKAQLQSALDSATLAATQALSYDNSVSQTELEKIAQNFFDVNTGSLANVVACKPLTLVIDRPEIRTEATTQCDVSTAFGAVLEADGYAMNLASVTDFDFGEADIAFMLDVSGSMSGSSKIGALKTAMTDAIDTLMAISVDGSVRIALAPYSTSLNAGSFADAATGYLADDGDDCVTERSGSQAFTDASPTVEPVTDKTYSCPSASILALTDNATALKAKVDALSAGGRTAGHLGIAWSWYLISPRWAGFWPAGSKPKASGASTRKAVVLMTDGEFNEYYTSGQGNSAKQAKNLCANMKDDDVLVYAVAFQAPSSAQELLEECSSGAGYYFEPDDSEALKEAYRAIADSFRRHVLTN